MRMVSKPTLSCNSTSNSSASNAFINSSMTPVLMYKALYTGEIQDMKDTNLMDCIECGCCAYNCPASVPLVLGIRSGKQVIRDAAAKAAAKAKA